MPLFLIVKKLVYKYHRTIVSILILILILIVTGMFYSGSGGSFQKIETYNGSCQDTDGDDIYTKGAIHYTDSKGLHTEEDYCVLREHDVYEMICTKISFFGKEYKHEKKTVPCEKGCINGACTQ